MLNDLQRRQLERAEQAHLREPDFLEHDPDEADAYTHTCKLCDCYPDDNILYLADGEWICAECLLNNLPKRDVYTGETFGI